MANTLYDFLTTESSSSATGGVNTAEGQDPSTVNDAMRQWKQLESAFLDDLNGVNTVTGTGDAIAVTAAQGFNAYGSSAGQIATGVGIRLIAPGTNTGAATLNVNTIGTRKIRKIVANVETALSAGDIAQGDMLFLIYRSTADTGTGAWILIGSAPVAAATTSASGIVELATVAEALTGTDAVRAVTPAGLYYPTGHVSPTLTLTKNGSDASNDIDISAFTARDSTDAANIVCAARTKQIDAVWAVGTNAGGLDTGSVSNTTYYIWGIRRSDTAVCDVLYSLSNTAPTMPTNYDSKVLLGELTRAGGVNGIPIIYGNPLVRFSGSLPIAAARAAVKYNGATGAIAWSINVSSVTDNGTGDQTVNFTTSFPDANYAPLATAEMSTSNQFDTLTAFEKGTLAVGSCRVRVGNPTTGPKDADSVGFVAYR